MCQKDGSKSSSPVKASPGNDIPLRTRRAKRDRDGQFVLQNVATVPRQRTKSKKQSRALQKHGKDAPSGGIESMLPSFIGIAILACAVMAQQGFRGRASVAGIDLGTTNSVICVQAPSKGVGEIVCIQDPSSGSPIVPSVVSFLEPHERNVGPSSKIKSDLTPHPSHVVVGSKAKRRIDSHPTRTLYNAKRVLGRSTSDPAIEILRNEVEFQIQDSGEGETVFQVDDLYISPRQVGSYIVFHLMQIAKGFLGHDNIKSAVLAVPAKFDTFQRQRTMEAFQHAGVKIARVLEEPAAAALAYGLHKKEGVEKILVYDFGGGTLDVSILHVSEGYVEVMGSDGDDRLGGADFDAAVAKVLTSRHEQTLKDIATYPFDAEGLSSSCPQITNELPLCSVSSFHTIGEQLKISLSNNTGTAHATCLALPPIEEGNPRKADVCEKLNEISLHLSLEDYDKAVKPLLDRSILPMTRLMHDLTLDPAEIDEIVMVGGTTRMPQVRALVAEAFSNAELNTHIDPDITVAYGAASVID
eukprot:scaffold25678_cov137-Cylindrotheca_fusiformis.AAC.1